jgi:hypothetical protein
VSVRGTFTLACVLCVSRGPDASAAQEDLREVAGRVALAWRGAGALVVQKDSRFVTEDETLTVDIRGQGASMADAGDCRRVALVGPRGLSFHVLAALAGDDDVQRVASTAGVVELHGCGTLPETVKLKTDSGRGTLETVVGTSTSGLPAVAAVLLERTGGVLPPPPEPGPLPPLPSPQVRVSAAESREVRAGLVVGPELEWTAGLDGKGGGPLVLTEGCHRFELFAVEPKREPGHFAHLDLDGALRREGGEVIAEDQGSAPDVRLDTCVAGATKVALSFEGAPRGSTVRATHATHDLPLHMPSLWSLDARARAARILLARRVQPLPDDAVFLARGASGHTPLSMPLEPGACYVAVAALERGRSHGVQVHVTLGGRTFHDEQGMKEGAGLVAFCARESTVAEISVDTRASATGWGLAVFRALGGAWP